jgi:hypothetical protein
MRDMSNEQLSIGMLSYPLHSRGLALMISSYMLIGMVFPCTLHVVSNQGFSRDRLLSEEKNLVVGLLDVGVLGAEENAEGAVMAVRCVVGHFGGRFRRGAGWWSL